jgi:hypothetical protein
MTQPGVTKSFKEAATFRIFIASNKKLEVSMGKIFEHKI